MKIQFVEGWQIGYLQTWPRIWTGEYRETNLSGQRGRFKARISSVKFRRPNHFAMPFIDFWGFLQSPNQNLIMIVFSPFPVFVSLLQDSKMLKDTEDRTKIGHFDNR